MFKSTTLITALTLSNLNSLTAECPNACNGHGKCTSYDMCDCNRNWQANDCSERVCQYGLAHVDTPKGDLNMNNEIDDADTILVENSFKYPYGTTEKFPRMQDSDLFTLTNTAHYYMECSNKGTCNRQTGTCECYPGYDGAACQRASCPGYPESCSGHGVCKTIRQLADANYSNVYELWDKDTTMGCECDAGFSGPDCSERLCKYDIDPLYFDDTSTTKTAVFDFAIVSNSTSMVTGFQDGRNIANTGTWAIVFYDMHGQKWQTSPLPKGATCTQVLDALKALPNNVIPGMDSTYCTLTSNTNVDPVSSPWTTATDNVHYTRNRPITYNMPFWFMYKYFHGLGGADSYTNAIATGAVHEGLTGWIYRLHFKNNPGAFRQPEINVHLDGPRPTLAAQLSDTNAELFTKVWTDGQQGENVDYFADHCAGVTASIDTVNHKLSGLSTDEKKLLKVCLGGSDFDDTNNVDLQNWDYGSASYPHLIKLVLTTAASSDGGVYVAIYSDGTDFFFYNPVVTPDNTATDVYEIYTTKGVLARTSTNAHAYFGFASQQIVTANVAYQQNQGSSIYSGDLSCEVTDRNSINSNYVTYCLNKSDIFTFINPTTIAANPSYINLYTVKKIYTTRYTQNLTDPHNTLRRYYPGDAIYALNTNDMFNKFGTHVIETDLSTNWAVNSAVSPGNAKSYLYKFFPNRDSSYEYVAQCSNRGICDTQSGLCNCFGGYTGDACQFQSSLAV